jgi:hypothetical protein
MDPDDELENEEIERGSDELLSDDKLRLPASASPLVRLHAIQAWLTRRERETDSEIGEAALELQYIMQSSEQDTRMRRREREALEQRVQYARQSLQRAQERKQAYEEAESLLEECIAHTTSNERALVEYYLILEDLMQSEETEEAATTTPVDQSARHQALADVQHRIEHVGTPGED